MAFIDTTVINVALPVLQSTLGAGVDDAQWIVDAYLLVLSSLILAGGSLGDQLGRTRVFGLGVATFTLASAWCGAAPSTGQLILARAVQGAGAALLVPGSLAMISSAFPEQTRGKAIGTWSSLTSLAIIAGPLLGGWLVQTISWRAAFLINIPLGIAVLLLLWRNVPRIEPSRKGSIDWLGTALITIALGGIVFALIEAPARGWLDGLVMTAAGAGLAGLVAFVVVERRVDNPIVPLRLFESRDFTAANVLTLLLYAALSAAMFLLPFNLIQVQGYTPTQAGAAFLPLMMALSILSRWTGALADRFGARPLLIAGPTLAGAGFLLLSIPGIGGSYWTTFFPGLLVLGLGMAATVAPLTTTVMTSFGKESNAGAASGINNAVARAAGLIAIAVFGAMAIGVFGRDLDARLKSKQVPDAVRQSMFGQRLRLAEAHPPAGLDIATWEKVEQAIDASFVRSFRISMIGAAALAFASALGGALVKKRG